MSVNDTGANETKPSAGTILRAAREKLDLTAEEVAAELRLGAFQIRALEDDRYDELPGATYVRGYLRAYARLVKVNEAEVLPSASGESDNVTTGQYQPAVRQAKSSDRHVKLISFIVASALVAFFVAWWQSRDESSMGIAEWNDASKASPNSAATADKQAAAPTLSAKTAMPRPATARVQSPVRSLPQAISRTGSPRQVGFRMRASSWLDVRDATNRRLLNRLVPAGESIAIEGEPPFRVFVGNAEGVSVDYSGRSFDASAYQTGIYARFVVGELAARR